MLPKIIVAAALVGSALVPFSSTASAVGTDAYISLTGSDSSACTQAAPCQTFTHAVDVMTSGGTLHVAAGDYGMVSISLPGDKSPLTVQGDGGVPGDVRVFSLNPGTGASGTFPGDRAGRQRRERRARTDDRRHAGQGTSLPTGASVLKLKTKKLPPGKYTITVTSGSVSKTTKLKVTR
jgi:hypothetical protein